MEEVARGIHHLPKNFLPFPSEYTFPVLNFTLEDIGKRLDEIIHSLNIRWHYRPAITTGVGFAKENVWSRSARRSKEKKEITATMINDHGNHDSMDEDEDEDLEPALGFKVTLRTESSGVGVEAHVRWLIGHDSVLFESFCGMLKRRITSA